ncbi:glycosyltransferase family 4 protein [Campylobacter gastrosuis]|uniref:Glycosyltransferase family 4 protein n=1 Tax=Campylobacter gastrosuis TaxID=2974576 RepID=A0ABT7HN01_9BACT|nr:glycosyltransferase family 4 protein [Campylobacter gastrosuis]MDL0088296.1 glycosyltransferase family 4 protein [Campylobacter gastrosuis]
MSKSIVFIGHYSGGKQDFDTRHYFFAKELASLGYKTTIINAAFSHRIHDAKVINEPFIAHSDGDIKFFSIKTPFYKGNGFGRIVNMFAFVINLIRNTKKILKEIGHIDTIVMATPQPFTIFAAKFISHKTKAKLIVEIKDIWPLEIIELANVSKFHPFVLLLTIIEKIIYKFQDKLISPLANINEYFSNIKTTNNAVYVPTGLDIGYYDSIKLDFVDNRLKDKFIVGYIGGLTASNCIDILLDVACELKEQFPNIIFLVVGKGAQRDYLIGKYASSNIIFFDSVPKSEAFKIMTKCDILYKSSPDLNFYKYGLSPLKINEYMYAKTTIIHAFNIEKLDMIKKANCGLSIKTNDKLALKEAILKIYNMSKDERDKLGQNGWDYVRQNLSYEKIVKEFLIPVL